MFYPHDLLRQTLDSAQVAFMFVHWASLLAPRSGLQDFDPAFHFLTGFESEGDAHPRGMSGSAGCIQRKRGDRVCVADLHIGGVTVGYYENSRLLKLVRREKIEEFLAAHFEFCSDSPAWSHLRPAAANRDPTVISAGGESRSRHRQRAVALFLREGAISCRGQHRCFTQHVNSHVRQSRDEKIQEHPRAHDADAVVLFQIEQI